MLQANVFYGGKSNCLTFSFDDGHKNDREIVKKLNEYGLKGTFHLNGNRVLRENDPESIPFDEVKTLYAGHEVACHTVNHGWQNTMPAATVTREFLKDREILERACGYIVRGMSYPFGICSESVVAAAKSCGIVYGRIVGDSHHVQFPEDFMRWVPTSHYLSALNDAKVFAGSQKNYWQRGVFYIWGHAHELTDDAKRSYFDELCKTLSGLENTWYATNIEIYEYIMAQRALQVSADESIVYNPTRIAVWFEKDKEIHKIDGGETMHF